MAATSGRCTDAHWAAKNTAPPGPHHGTVRLRIESWRRSRYSTASPMTWSRWPPIVVGRELKKITKKKGLSVTKVADNVMLYTRSSSTTFTIEADQIIDGGIAEPNLISSPTSSCGPFHSIQQVQGFAQHSYYQQ